MNWITADIYWPQGEGIVFTGVCLSTIGLVATRSLLGLVMVRSVCILLEFFLVHFILLPCYMLLISVIKLIFYTTSFSRMKQQRCGPQVYWIAPPTLSRMSTNNAVKLHPNSAIHKAASLTAHSHSMTLPGIIPKISKGAARMVSRNHSVWQQAVRRLCD